MDREGRGLEPPIAGRDHGDRVAVVWAVSTAAFSAGPFPNAIPRLATWLVAAPPITQVRWSLSRASFEHVVADLGPNPQVIQGDPRAGAAIARADRVSAPGWIGAYPVRAVLVEKDHGLLFVIQARSLSDLHRQPHEGHWERGFAHLPDGFPDDFNTLVADLGELETTSLTRLDDTWYTWEVEIRD